MSSRTSFQSYTSHKLLNNRNFVEDHYNNLILLKAELFHLGKTIDFKNNRFGFLTF
jgi:hypothetical protein